MASLAVQDRALTPLEAAVTREEIGAAGAREEAEVLGGGAARHREAGVLGALAHLWLGEGAEREAQPHQRTWGERRESVALVLALVEGHPQQRLTLLAGMCARVVPRGQRWGPQALCQLEHCVETHIAVAAHTRIRRESRCVIGEPAIHHARPELLAQVDREVRHPHAVG